MEQVDPSSVVTLSLCDMGEPPGSNPPPTPCKRVFPLQAFSPADDHVERRMTFGSRRSTALTRLNPTTSYKPWEFVNRLASPVRKM